MLNTKILIDSDKDASFAFFSTILMTKFRMIDKFHDMQFVTIGQHQAI